MKPLALDLCCGKGGWTNGLLKAGWDVIGVDIEDMGGYQGHLILADVREVAKDVEKFFPALNFDLIVASPPCQEFSYRSFPFKRCRELAKNVPPDKSIWLACENIAKTLRKPIIIENVRGAQPYMGKARFHNGAFYFWGDVPALMPTIRPKKGFERISPNYEQLTGKHAFRGDNPFGDQKAHKKASKTLFKDMPHAQSGSRLSVRKEWSAKIAMIPDEIGEWIGKCFYASVV